MMILTQRPKAETKHTCSPLSGSRRSLSRLCSWRLAMATRVDQGKRDEQKRCVGQRTAANYGSKQESTLKMTSAL